MIKNHVMSSEMKINLFLKILFNFYFSNSTNFTNKFKILQINQISQDVFKFFKHPGRQK